MNTRNSRGFALPAVLISSIIMLTVLFAAVTSTVAVRASLKSQYYNQLTQTASEAGLTYAKACMAANGGAPSWPDRPLMPNTDCSGTVTHVCAVNSTEAECSVVVDTGTGAIASFSVPLPLADSNDKLTNITSYGTTNLIRSGDHTIWRQYTQTSQSSQATASLAAVSSKWKQLATGAYHTCGIDSNDQVWCWGLNNQGQLGNNSTTDSLTPVDVDTSGVLKGKTVKSITAGMYHTCVIANDAATGDQAYCWGYNGYGQLGNSSTTSRAYPVAVTTSGVLVGKSIISLSAGPYYSTCAVAYSLATGNLAYCWGRNNLGQLGDNSITTRSSPVAVDTTGVLSGKAIKSISPGYYHACAIATDATLGDQAYCWGYNAYGQLGNTSNTDSLVPVIVTNSGLLSGKTVKSIASGYYHTCVIASDSKPYCWGYNSYSNLGDNTTVHKNSPVATITTGVLNGKIVASVDSYYYTTCVITSENKPYCWGLNNYGQLGDGSITTRATPVAVNADSVLNSKSIISMANSVYHTCALDSGGVAYCWGYNAYGQLGTNNMIDSLIPVNSFAPPLNSTYTKNYYF